MAKCLVLGSNGFIGSHLTDALVAAGHTVRAFDRYGLWGQVFNKSDSVELFEGNFMNSSERLAALKDIEYVFHLVSTTTPITAENDPLIDIDTNIRESVRLMQECVESGVKKLIFASTGGSIYGSNSTAEPIPETTLPAPVSPYAIGKLTIEHYMHYFKKKFSLDSVVYRISNPYGERQSITAKQGVIPIFLQHIARGEPITVLGDGSMVRDFIYVKDVAAMVVGSFETSKESVYNIGSGTGVSINELVEAVKESVDKPVAIENKESYSTFVDKVVLDTNLFRNEFKIEPQTDLKTGIIATWKFVQKKVAEAEA